MLTSLKTRLLLAAAVVIALALIANAAISYVTLQRHNDQQVARNLTAVAEGNGLAISEWLGSRIGMLEALTVVPEGHDPMPPLLQLEASGGFIATYLADPQDGGAIFSDGWIAPADYDPRERDWYRQEIGRAHV